VQRGEHLAGLADKPVLVRSRDGGPGCGQLGAGELRHEHAATKNAVRTLLEGLRQESTDGVLRTTAVSPGFVRTELADSIDNPEVREQIRRSRDEFAIPPHAVARAIAFAVEQPYDVEIGDITIRPAAQG
jgi:NADP-dependent 3-hydroxy acid dehydrogenase YdfG